MSMANSSKELAQGHILLNALMSSSYTYLNAPFIEEVDVDGLGLNDYNDIVKEPMWMEKMHEKFEAGIYQSIGDFVCDFRLMLLNCYHYNGVDSKMGKLAEKLETLFEQRLQVLPYDIRQKTTVQATLSNSSSVEEDIGDAGFSRRRQAGRILNNDGRQSTPMLSVAEELETHSANGGLSGPELQAKIMDIVSRLRNWERKRHDQRLLDSWDDWWKARVSDDDDEVLKISPELPDIFQFLCVARQSLHLDDIIPGGTGLWFAELEAALVAPRGSTLLAAIVTTLLSKGRERASLSKKPLPSYARWNYSLQKRLNYWYQVLHERAKGDASVVLYKIGVEEIFFKVFGYKSNLMRKKHFHELSIYQRIIALKSLIDYVVWTQDTVRACIDEIDWNLLRPIVIGNHGGFNYIRFPTFDPSGALRIYRERVLSWPDDTPEDIINNNRTFGYIPAGEPYSERGDNITTFCFIVPPVGGKPQRKPVWMKYKGKFNRTGRDMSSLINTISSNRSAAEKKTRRSKRKTLPRNGTSRNNLSTMNDNMANSPYASQTPSEVGTFDGEETDSLMETDDNTMDCTMASSVFGNNTTMNDQSLLSLPEKNSDSKSQKCSFFTSEVKEEMAEEVDPDVAQCLNALLDKVSSISHEVTPSGDAVNKEDMDDDITSEDLKKEEEEAKEEEEEEEIPEILKPGNDFKIIAQELPQISALLNELQSELETLEDAVEKQSRTNRRRAAKKVSATPSDFDSSLQGLRDLVSSIVILKNQFEEREPIRFDEMKLIRLRIRKQDESYENSKVKKRDDKILETAGDESPPEDDDDDLEGNSRAARLARRLQRIEEEKFTACKPSSNDVENDESNNSIRESSAIPVQSLSNSSLSNQRRSRRARRPNMTYYHDSDMESPPNSASEDSDGYSGRREDDDEDDYRPPTYHDKRRVSASKRTRSSFPDARVKVPRLSNERRELSPCTPSSTMHVNGNCYMAIPRLTPKPQPTVIARALSPYINTNTAVQYSSQSGQPAQFIVQPTIRVAYPNANQNLRLATVVNHQMSSQQNRTDIPIAYVRPLLQQPNSTTVSVPNHSSAPQTVPVTVSNPLTVRTNLVSPPTVTITNHVSPPTVVNPLTAQSTARTSPAKKVFRVFEHFFTEDLQPVSLNGEAGTMTYLPKESVPSQRYELARRMIAVYKSKQQPQSNSQNTTTSFSSS